MLRCVLCTARKNSGKICGEYTTVINCFILNSDNNKITKYSNKGKVVELLKKSKVENLSIEGTDDYIVTNEAILLGAHDYGEIEKMDGDKSLVYHNTKRGPSVEIVETSKVEDGEVESGENGVEKEMDELERDLAELGFGDEVEEVEEEEEEEEVEEVEDIEEDDDDEELIDMSDILSKGDVSDVEEDISMYDKNCVRCKGLGKYEDMVTRIKVKCTCNKRVLKEKIISRPLISVNKATKINIVVEGLVSEERVNDEFKSETGKARIIKTLKDSNYILKNYDSFCELCNKLIVTCSDRKAKIDGSYIIGAPTSCGKQTFVNTCIKRLYANGKKVVPYISLFELAELRAEYEERLRHRIVTRFSEKQEVEVEYSDKDDYSTIKRMKYKWEDYMNADVLFCYLTGAENKFIESETLYTIIKSRGMNSLPTIVTVETSLDMYKIEPKLREYIWEEIMQVNDGDITYKKMTHRSTYKQKKMHVGVRTGRDI